MKLSISDREYLLKKGYDIRDILTRVGYGEHAQVYDWLDGCEYPQHVLLYSMEYRKKELDNLISTTHELAYRNVNLPKVHDYMPLSYWTSEDIYKRELAKCPVICPEEIDGTIDTIVVLEDKIEGPTLRDCSRDKCMLLNMPNSSYKKLFEDAYHMINAGIRLDLNRSANIKVCDDQFYYLDIHMPVDGADKRKYLTYNTEVAYVNLIDLLVTGQKGGRWYEVLLEDCHNIDSQDVYEACVRSKMYYKARQALSSIDFDIENRDNALRFLDATLYAKQIYRNNKFLKESDYEIDDEVFAIDELGLSTSTDAPALPSQDPCE